MIHAATVDVGTNSVLLLVAELEGCAGAWTARILDERCRITRLGEGLDAPGQPVAPEAAQRTLTAIGDYAQVMDRLGATRRAAVGTAVLREASDSRSFCAQAAALLGCPLEIISGEREAALSLAGVRGAFGALPERTLLFDVGGGSTELVLVGAAGVDSVSLPLGAVRVTGRHLRADPPHPTEIEAVRAPVRRTLASLPAAFRRPLSQLIGLAGTVTTLCTVELGLREYDTERVNGTVLDRAALARQIERYATLPLEERRRIRGLEPARADIILGGALIVEGILERFGAERFRVCDRGVRWGRLWELVGKAAAENGQQASGDRRPR